MSNRCPNHPEMRGIEGEWRQLPEIAKYNTLAQLQCFQRVASFALRAFALQRPGVQFSSGPKFGTAVMPNHTVCSFSIPVFPGQLPPHGMADPPSFLAGVERCTCPRARHRRAGRLQRPGVRLSSGPLFYLFLNGEWASPAAIYQMKSRLGRSISLSRNVRLNGPVLVQDFIS